MSLDVQGYAKLGYEMTGSWNLREMQRLFQYVYRDRETSLLDGDQRITER